jgi:hypothetical protein
LKEKNNVISWLFIKINTGAKEMFDYADIGASDVLVNILFKNISLICSFFVVFSWILRRINT